MAAAAFSAFFFVISITVIVGGPVKRNEPLGEDSADPYKDVIGFDKVDIENRNGRGFMGGMPNFNRFGGNNGFGFGSSGNFDFQSQYQEAINAANAAAAATQSMADDFPNDWKNWDETMKNMEKELMDNVSGWHNDGSGSSSSSVSVTSSTVDGVTTQCTSINGEPEKCITMPAGQPSVVSYESPGGSSNSYSYSWSE